MLFRFDLKLSNLLYNFNEIPYPEDCYSSCLSGPQPSNPGATLSFSQ
jgi:hypothetical protein